LTRFIDLVSPVLPQLGSKEVMSALVLVLLGGLLLFLGGLRASCSDEGGASQQIEDSAPTEHDRSPLVVIIRNVSQLDLFQLCLKILAPVAMLLTQVPSVPYVRSSIATSA
jgi:hypothetical protein